MTRTTLLGVNWRSRRQDAMPAVTSSTTTYLVSVTSSLTGTQGLGFALVAGDDLPGNNSVFLSGFNFYGGSGRPV